MKKIVGWTMTSAVICLVGNPIAIAGTKSDKAANATNAAIVAQIEKLELAAVEARSLDDLRKLYAPDVMDFTPSHAMLGFDNLVMNMGAVASQVKNWNVPIVPGSLHITATSDMAVASSLQVWNSDYADDGTPAMQMFYRQTDVWMRQPDSSWRIVAAHSSIPIDPITERPLCVHVNGYCPLPNFPHRGMSYEAVNKLNQSYGDPYGKIAEANAKGTK